MASRPEFNTLYREHYARVFGLCRRLLNSPSLAEDATQDAFMKAYSNFRRYDPAQPFWQWIATIANNTCIDVLRRQKRERMVFDASADEEAEAGCEADAAVPLTLDQLVADEEAGLLNRAIEQLSDKYRIPLVMAYYQDTSYEEIAATLDITVSHVGVLLLRAKKQLRAQVEQLSSAAAENVRLS